DLEPGDQGHPDERLRSAERGGRRLAEQVAQRLVDLACLVLPIPGAEEGGEGLEWGDSMTAVTGWPDHLVGLAQQLLRLAVPPLGGADEAEGESCRRVGADIRAADGLARVERKPLRL